MRLKRYSPKAAAQYLRDWIKNAGGKHFSGSARPEDVEVLQRLDTLVEVEVLKRAQHIEDIVPTKGLLIDILKIESARFWDLYRKRQFDVNGGYAQVLRGRVTPQLYAEWTALEVVSIMLRET